MTFSDDNDRNEAAISSVREIAERLEQAWSTQADSSKGIDLTGYLPTVCDPLRRLALVELIKVDLAWRWRRGSPASLEMYVEKFPELGSVEEIPAELIFEEYRVRTRHGAPAPLSQYKSRFPSQFAEVEGLIQTENSQMTAPSDRGTKLGDAPSADAPLALVGANTIVGGHYVLSHRIGTGGFGEVWKGNDVRGHIPKAIKIITRSIESDEAKTELHALEIITRLNHPYLLRTECYFAEQNRLIVVMELADGSLREALKKAKKETNAGLPIDKLIGYMKHAADALDYLHSEGIFHRDIKPENILLVGRIAKVADFGLARLAANKHSTKTNFAGTAAYSSPETWKGRVTARSDQYSLAATYGELRLGRPVFTADNFLHYMHVQLNNEPELDPMPEAEKRVVLRAMSKEPSDRYPSCGEFIRELELATRDAVALPPSSPPKADSTVHSIRPTQVVNRTPTSGKEVPSSQKRPPSWRPPSKVEIDDLLPPDPPAPYVRRTQRRRKKASPFVGAAVLLVLIAAAAIGGSFYLRGAVERTVNRQVDQLDFLQARKTIDGSNMLVAPFRAELTKGVLAKGVEFAEKASKNMQFDELTKIAVAVADAYPTDKQVPEILDDAAKRHAKDLEDEGNLAEASRYLASLPPYIPARQRLADVQRKWLDRGWVELERENYPAARRIADDVLRQESKHAEAKILDDLSRVAENRQAMISRGEFSDIMRSLTPPVPLPARAKDLARRLKDDVRSAWLKQADALIDGRDSAGARKVLAQFALSFPNDAEAAAKMRDALGHLLKDYFGDRKFPEALALLDDSKVASDDLRNSVKVAWRDAELKRFQSKDDADKEQALKSLAELSRQFAVDADLQRDYAQRRDDFLEHLFRQMEDGLKAMKPALVLDLVERARPYVPDDPAKGTQLDSMQLLAACSLRDDSAADPGAIETLFKQIMQRPASARHLPTIAGEMVKRARRDPSFEAKIATELAALAEVVPPKSLPADYWKLKSVTALPPASVDGPGKLLSEAKSLLQRQQPRPALATLKRIDPAADPAIRKEYYALYARLGELVPLERAEIQTLKSALERYPDLKPAIGRAIERTIAESWKICPTSAELWRARIEDADAVDNKTPLVLAFKAEALLETDAPVPFMLPSGEGDEKGYIDYVRARVGIAMQKGSNVSDAAKTIVRLSGDEDWLVADRRVRAAKILEDAALNISVGPDGRRRLYSTPREAADAYAWLVRSLMLKGKSATDAVELPVAAELGFALAAASKSPPRFDVSRPLVADLLARHADKLPDVDRIDLVLSNPRPFSKELAGLRKDIGVNELSGWLRLGEAQLDTDPDDRELRDRQSLLYALKGSALEQVKHKNFEAIWQAYAKASQHSPDDVDCLIKSGLYGALAKRAEAERERNPETQHRLLKQGVSAANPALVREATKHPDWADLCLQRSQLALEIGNNRFAANDPIGLKEAFLEARDFAVKARDAAIPHAKPEDVQFALGNAYEDLAYFARVDIQKNYELSAAAFDQAAKRFPDYRIGSGRSRHRWAVDQNATLDKAERTKTFESAIANLKDIAANPKSYYAAEANYWKGMAHWYLEDISQAFDAFSAGVALALNDGAEPWAGWAFTNAVKLASDQTKDNPEKTLEWLARLRTQLDRVKAASDLQGADERLAPVEAHAKARDHLRQATVNLNQKNIAGLKNNLDRALAAKSPHEHEIVCERALLMKAAKLGLKLTPEELTAIHNQAVASIQASSLADAEKQSYRNTFEGFWNKLP